MNWINQAVLQCTVILLPQPPKGLPRPPDRILEAAVERSGITCCCLQEGELCKSQVLHRSGGAASSRCTGEVRGRDRTQGLSEATRLQGTWRGANTWHQVSGCLPGHLSAGHRSSLRSAAAPPGAMERRCGRGGCRRVGSARPLMATRGKCVRSRRLPGPPRSKNLSVKCVCTPGACWALTLGLWGRIARPSPWIYFCPQ